VCIETLEENEGWGTVFCGGIDNIEQRKGGEYCCKGRTTIHKSAVENIASHRGVDNGRSTTRVMEMQ
jgi:hypothetical protein